MQLTRKSRNTAAAAQRPTPSSRLGFTVIELMMVVAIIGIIATLAFPKVNFTQYQVDAGARLIRINLQNAQRLAVARQYDVIVSFDVAKNSMRIVEDGNDNGAVDAGERVSWRSLEDNVHFAVPITGLNGVAGSPVIGSNLKTIDGMPSVIFRRDGAASSDVEIYLTSKRAKSNDYRAVQVVQATGRSDWFKYISSKWKQGNL